MNPMTLVAICLSLFLLSSCNKKGITSDVVLKGEGQIQQHLDSTTTLKNVELELIQRTIVKNLNVENNHLVFALTKEEFVKLGLPECYYDRIIVDLKNGNNLIDSLGIENAEQLLNESYRDLYNKFYELNR